MNLNINSITRKYRPSINCAKKMRFLSKKRILDEFFFIWDRVGAPDKLSITGYCVHIFPNVTRYIMRGLYKMVYEAKHPSALL